MDTQGYRGVKVMKKEKNSTKGRQKIEMKPIVNNESRQVCFSKRRAGLFKKASEVSVLCGAEVGIVVFSPGGKPFVFGHPYIDAVVDQGTTIADPEVPVGELEQQHQELLKQIEAETKRKEALEKMLAERAACEKSAVEPLLCQEEGMEKLGLEELTGLLKGLEQLRENVEKRARELLTEQAMTKP